MKKANETSVMFATDEQMYEDKKLFVENLGWLLSQTRDGVSSCELDETGNLVIIHYGGGTTRKINIHMDSYGAIIRDVANRFQ